MSNLEKRSISVQGDPDQHSAGVWSPGRQSLSRVSTTSSVTGAHYKGGHDTLAKSSVNGELVPEAVAKMDVATMEQEGYDDDGHVMRTGNVWTASANIITAVIGAGVLSLAWCTAQVGWIAGPIMQIMFASITLYCSLLFCDCYRYPHPITGERCYTYTMSVRRYLGTRYVIFCGIVQYLNLVATGIGYTVTSGLAMVAVYRSHCYHKTGLTMDTAELLDPAPCHPAINKYMIIFGCIQLLFTQIPNMEEIWWVSIVAAIMSFVYSTIGLGLSIGKATEPQYGPHSHSHGTLGGIPVGDESDGVSSVQKCWNFMLALGNVAFAYSYSFILIEICDTLKSPGENRVLKQASVISIGVTTFYYMAIGTIGYAALGDDAPGNLLTGFGFYQPWWLLMLANLAIVIHLIGGYQVWTQPFLMMVESNLEQTFPNNRLLQAGFNVPAGRNKVWHVRYYILVWRSVYVVFTTIIAILAPFFNDIVGIMGSLGFWPLTVFLPISMHIVQKNIPMWSPKWILLHSLSVFSFFISVTAMIGSIAGVIEDTKGYQLWHAKY